MTTDNEAKKEISCCDYCNELFHSDDLVAVGKTVACYGCVEDAVIGAFTGENTKWDDDDNG